MSRLDRLRSWVTKGDSSSSGESDYVEGHTPGDAAREPDGTVQKQKARSEAQKQGTPQRRNRLPPELERQVRQHGAAMKPYDAEWLQTLADNWVVQAYIDTMAQDLATAPWHLKPRDEDVEVGEDEIGKAERRLQMLHPEKSFRDLREMAARTTLKLGDGAWVKHYDESGELAEAIPVDTSRLYKQVNEHGLTEGYVEVSWNRNMVQTEWDLSEVVWFEWSSREGHVYGQGPVEKGADVIEVLEELGDKELKDLKEGMPPGIVSVKEDEDTPMAVDSYEKVKSNWKLKEGERHRAIVSMGDWQFTPLDPGYQELQFMERNKLWIQSLGAVFKVNAPYAGFDFQEGNKAQNTSQTEAYKQRGFAVLLRQMEEAINRQLIWEDISEDLEFEFETVASTEEKQAEAQYQDQLATAAESWDNLGREVHLRDGRLEIEDGKVDAPEDSGGDNPFGGGFGMSEDGPEPEAEPEPVEADAEQTTLTKQEVAKLDETLLEAHRSQVQPETLDDIEKRVWTENDQVPEYVRDRIKDAIDGGAVFEDIQSVPDRTVERLKEILSDAMTQPQGWSMDSVVGRMKDEWPGVSEEKLEVVARTETASVLNTAREEGYEELPGDDQPTFYWEGPKDSRTTVACDWLKGGDSLAGEGPSFKGTNPDFGGEPVTMNELKRLERDATAAFFDHLDYRKHTVHPNERHTFVRAPSTEVDWD